MFLINKEMLPCIQLFKLSIHPLNRSTLGHAILFIFKWTNTLLTPNQNHHESTRCNYNQPDY